ncbi:MAG: hypothetical protein AAF747_09810 [Planctomycetota bacterium]
MTETTPPERSKADLGHAAVKAALGSIPLFGSTAAEAFAFFITPPVERRRGEWMRQVGEKLDELAEKHEVDLEELQRDESFVDTVMQASHIAMRNSQDEKRRALANALVNSALPEAPDAAERQMYVKLIDDFTAWHLRLLALFADPTAWFERNNVRPPNGLISSSRADVLKAAYAELKHRRDFCDQVWKDIHAAGLTGVDSLQGMLTPAGAMQPILSERGLAFLAFVSEPDSTA